MQGDTLRVAITRRHDELLEEDVLTTSAFEPGRAMLRWGPKGFEYRFVRR